MSRLSDFFSLKPYVMLPDKIPASLSTRQVDKSFVITAVQAAFPSTVELQWSYFRATESQYRLYPRSVLDKAYNALVTLPQAGDCDNEPSKTLYWYSLMFDATIPNPIIVFSGIREGMTHMFYADIDDRLQLKFRNVQDVYLKQYTKIVDIQIRG